jgi:hypothetical protein
MHACTWPQRVQIDTHNRLDGVDGGDALAAFMVGVGTWVVAGVWS